MPIQDMIRLSNGWIVHKRSSKLLSQHKEQSQQTKVVNGMKPKPVPLKHASLTFIIILLQL